MTGVPDYYSAQDVALWVLEANEEALEVIQKAINARWRALKDKQEYENAAAAYVGSRVQLSEHMATKKLRSQKGNITEIHAGGDYTVRFDTPVNTGHKVHYEVRVKASAFTIIE